MMEPTKYLSGTTNSPVNRLTVKMTQKWVLLPKYCQMQLTPAQYSGPFNES